MKNTLLLVRSTLVLMLVGFSVGRMDATNLVVCGSKGTVTFVQDGEYTVQQLLDGIKAVSGPTAYFGVLTASSSSKVPLTSKAYQSKTAAQVRSCGGVSIFTARINDQPVPLLDVARKVMLKAIPRANNSPISGGYGWFEYKIGTKATDPAYAIFLRDPKGA